MTKMSTYQNGFADGVVIRGVPITQMHPGLVFYVGNNPTKLVGESDASNNNNGSFFKPFATIQYAVSRCAANRGDIIIVRAGYTETVSSAAGLNVNVAGVAIIGQGRGSARPTITLAGSTAATLAISAANTLLSNLLIVGGLDAIAVVVDITASDVILAGIEYRDTAATQCTIGFRATNVSRVQILNLVYRGDSSAGTSRGILLQGVADSEITIDYMDGNFSTGGVATGATACTNLFIHDVMYFRTRNAADIFFADSITGSTGQVGPNLNLRLQDDAANITECCTGATMVYMQPINVVNAAGESSMQINITASTDA